MEGRSTYSGAETSLDAANAFVSPRFCHYIEGIAIDLWASSLDQLALQLESCFGNLCGIRDSDLYRYWESEIANRTRCNYRDTGS